MKRDSFSPPKNPVIGQLFYDSMTGTMRKWNGKDWTEEVRPGELSVTSGKPNAGRTRWDSSDA